MRHFAVGDRVLLDGVRPGTIVRVPLGLWDGQRHYRVLVHFDGDAMPVTIRADLLTTMKEQP